jgi:PST family polysaccharide transporter
VPSGSFLAPRRIRFRFPRPLASELLSLYGVHLATYLLPIVTIPYLTHILGVRAWGELASAQGFGIYIAIIVEYGFNLSATREIAKDPTSLRRAGGLAADVTSAKLALGALCVLVAVVLRSRIPIFRDNPLLFWSSLFFGISQGLNLLWLYQGLGRLVFASRLDIGCKALATVGIFVLVRENSANWIVLMLQATGAFLSFALLFTFALRRVGFQVPRAASVYHSLRMGWTMFLYAASLTLYAAGNAFILGLFVHPEFVGYYAAGEKIVKALCGLITPIGQVVYPRIIHLLNTAPARAVSLARHALTFASAASTAIAIGALAGAPWIVRYFLGPSFGPAVVVIRVLCILIPMVAISNVLGIQWMLPLGMDWIFNAIVVSAGVTNIAVMLIIAPSYAHIGAAIAAVVAEIFVTLAMLAVLIKHNLFPFHRLLTSAGRVLPPQGRRNNEGNE